MEVGRIIYLMVRVDKLSPEKILEVTNWCLHSFDLRNLPIPDLRFEIKPIGNQAWLTFYREVSYLPKPEPTPFELSDEVLGKVLDTLRDPEDNPITLPEAKDFRERMIVFFRLNSSIPPAIFAASEDLVRDAYYTAIFLGHGLWHIDKSLLDGSIFFTTLVLDEYAWGVVRVEKGSVQNSEEPNLADDFAKKTDLGPFLRPKGDR